MKNNWQIKKLGELCKITTGNSNTVDAIDDGQYAFFDRSKTIKRSNHFLFDAEALIIPGEGAEFFPRFYSGKFDLHQRAYALLDFKKDVDIKFIEYFLIFEHKYFERVAVGATAKSLRRRHFEDLEIPVPAITEQKRIVKILDEVFDNIKKAKENDEENLQNSKELFESYSQSIFLDKGNVWDKKKLDEVCIVQRGSSPRPIKNYITNDIDGVNWIKIGDTKNIDRYLYSTNQKITREGAKKSRLVKEGDLILSNSMSFGKPYIMKTTGYIHDGWFVLRPNSNLNTEYFYDVISSPQLQKQFISLASGAIVKNISGDLTKKAILPLPPLHEQKAIVKKLNAFSAKTKKLEVIYNQKLANLEELKKSVLNKAFEGEL